MKTKPRYKAHYGKSQPVADDVMVEVVFRDGVYSKALAKMWTGDVDWWKWQDVDDCDIIAYRILEDEQ